MADPSPWPTESLQNEAVSVYRIKIQVVTVTPASNKGAFKAPLAAALSAKALAPAPCESRVFKRTIGHRTLQTNQSTL